MYKHIQSAIVVETEVGMGIFLRSSLELMKGIAVKDLSENPWVECDCLMETTMF